VILTSKSWRHKTKQKQSWLYIFQSQPGVNCASFQNLVDGAFLVAHVGQFGLTGAKTNGGDAGRDGGHRIRAEIPVLEGLRSSPIDLLNRRAEGLHQRVIAADLPRGVQRFIGDGFSGPCSCCRCRPASWRAYWSGVPFRLKVASFSPTTMRGRDTCAGRGTGSARSPVLEIVTEPGAAPTGLSSVRG